MSGAATSMAFPPSLRTSSITLVTAGWELLTIAFLDQATGLGPWLGNETDINIQGNQTLLEIFSGKK
jgi:hypothetical protein